MNATTNTAIRRIAAAGASVALAAPFAIALVAPANATDIDLGTRSGDAITISGPAKAKLNKLFRISCAAPTDLAGARIHLYQNGNILKLSKVTVNAQGACNFKVQSGIKGLNVFDVAIKKKGVTYQSNEISVQVGAKTTQAKQPKGDIKIKGAATTTQWAKYKIACTAPASLAGGKVTLYQNGAILPQKKGFTVGSDGSCNFWIKSGIVGLNTFDMSVRKSGRTYQSNSLQVTVNPQP